MLRKGRGCPRRKKDKKDECVSVADKEEGTDFEERTTALCGLHHMG